MLGGSPVPGAHEFFSGAFFLIMERVFQECLKKGSSEVDVLSRLFKTSLLHLYTGLRTYLGLEVSRLETIPQKTSGLAPLRSSLLCCH